MPCYHPWKPTEQLGLPPTLLLPCGQCIGCRLERSRQWAIRCMHEAQLHSHNCFITLTYDEAPETLTQRDLTLFLKRTRKKMGKFRYYACGEYGEQFGRPHFHACLFGINFHDRYPWRKNTNGDQLYRSATLERLWQYGNSEIGAVTFQSAAYVARYVMKKITGDRASSHYTLLTPDGELITQKPEFNTMSRHPGLGAAWLRKYRTDVYPRDEVITNGHPSKPPRYYDKLNQKLHKEEMTNIKKLRIKQINHADNTAPRLKTKETVKRAQLASLKRNFH